MSENAWVTLALYVAMVVAVAIAGLLPSLLGAIRRVLGWIRAFRAMLASYGLGVQEFLFAAPPAAPYTSATLAAWRYIG